MHSTAEQFFQYFLDVYSPKKRNIKILEIGSLDVSGGGAGIRRLIPNSASYIGVDFVEGPCVDIVLNDPYHLPFAVESFDICVCTSVFEHSEFFWLLFNEIMRVLKPDGLFYLNSPSNGTFHRYPVDCWRFYPDAGLALERWSLQSGNNSVLLESFIGKQTFLSNWNDFVAVFLKDKDFASSYSDRILDRTDSFVNGIKSGSQAFLNLQVIPEDQTGHLLRRARRKVMRIIYRLFGYS